MRKVAEIIASEVPCGGRRMDEKGSRVENEELLFLIAFCILIWANF